ncbi:Plexin-B3 [Plecturocebus cupreus]
MAAAGECCDTASASLPVPAASLPAPSVTQSPSVGALVAFQDLPPFNNRRAYQVDERILSLCACACACPLPASRCSSCTAFVPPSVLLSSVPLPPPRPLSAPPSTLLWSCQPRAPTALTRALSQAPVMVRWRPFGLCVLLLLLSPPPLPLTGAHRFSTPNTTLNHLALAAGRGTLYVGAVNRLFQLSPELRLEATAVTGPVIDSPDCVPFRDPAECPQAQLTDNANQLLLVSSRTQELVACGQVRQGVCETRRLGDVAEVLYQAEDPGDGQFVAANTPGVATVGLVVPSPSRDLLLVARGLAGKLSAGVPPLAVRQLAGPQPFSSEGLGRLVVGDFSDYNNSYVGAFADNRSAYFVFRRRGARAQAEYRSYVARVCLGDANLYSYVEVPLACQGQGLIQAAFLAPGTLLGAFAAGPRGTQAALCAFPMVELGASMEQARRLCYTAGGRGPSGAEEATVEYGVTSRCVTLPLDSPESYPCGDEHTPSPIAGRQPLEAQPLLQLTQPVSAVAALQADGHMIAFLGDTQGQLHKVFLHGSQGQVYHSQQVGPLGSAISPDLLLDSSGSHLYVLTAHQVDQIPVAACPQFPDCTSCLQAQDPLCGWCVLQGRCTRKGQCRRAGQPNQWLWSYEEDSHCPHIQSLLPGHHPRQEQGQVRREPGQHGHCLEHEPRLAPVLIFLCSAAAPSSGHPLCSGSIFLFLPTACQVTLSVPRLPTLAADEYFHCAFGDYDSLAYVEGPHVACVTPSQDQVPLNPPGTDHVTVPLALMFEDVTVAATNFSFYDCSTVQALEVAAPCRACVGSIWRCHWCPQSSHCVYGEHCPEGERTIYSAQEVDVQARGPGACPQVEGLAGPHLVPVGWESRLALLVRNLQHFRGLPASFHCWLELPGELRGLPATLEETAGDSGLIHCQAHQFHPSMSQRELSVPIYVTQGKAQRLDNARALSVILYDCAMGHPDCSHCQAANGSLGCLWCADGQPACRYGPLCPPGAVELLCPAPSIDAVEPLTGPPEGGLALTILGSNLGRTFTDVQYAVSVASRPCNPEPSLYRTSARIVCVTSPAPNGTTGPVRVAIKSQPPGISSQHFTYQDPVLLSLSPSWGPQAGGTQLTIRGQHLQTGSNTSAFVGGQPCPILEPVCPEAIVCRTRPQAVPGEAAVLVVFGHAQRTLLASPFRYTANPQLIAAEPSASFWGGGRLIRVRGTGLDVVQRPLLSVWLEADGVVQAPRAQSRDPEPRRSCGAPAADPQACIQLGGGLLQCSTVCSANSSSLLLCWSPAVPDGARPRRVFFTLDNVQVDFASASGGQGFLYQPNPRLAPLSHEGPARPYRLKPGHILDVEVRATSNPAPPGHSGCLCGGRWLRLPCVSQGEGLNLGISKEEVRVYIGRSECLVKTLTRTHLYCEPPVHAPQPANGSTLPQFVVQMGNVRLALGPVQYEAEPPLSAFPVEAQAGLGMGAAVLIAAVLLLTLMYRHKSKQALRDYQKVLLQLESLETGVGDQCRKEFTGGCGRGAGGWAPMGQNSHLSGSWPADLMTEMTDLSSDLEASGIPFLDYHTYAERAFFPGHGGYPLQPQPEGPGEDGRCATVRQGLTQLSNLLNSKLFLLTVRASGQESPVGKEDGLGTCWSEKRQGKSGASQHKPPPPAQLIHTLEEQPSFTQRDRCHVASLLSLALHGKLEYLTDIMRTLLGDLAAHYVHRNPKLMLRRLALTWTQRTETMVEKLLTNWLSICLYTFLRVILAVQEVAGEPLYMLFRAIQYQVDKGPVDAVTGKAKRTLNDSRLLREDVEFRPLTLMVLVGPGAGGAAGSSEVQRVPARVLDTDTITQVKEKVLDQVYKGTPFSQRPSVHALDLEWRSGLAGHLTLSDEDLTSVTHNHWKRLNTLQHYKVPDGATVGLVPQLRSASAGSQSLAQSCPLGDNIPMLEDGEEGGVHLWHLVKATEEPEEAKVWRGNLREREPARAKAIPEIYLTRLLSMKGTLQKFVDDTFQAILSVNRPVPIAVKYLFDVLDELAEKHGIEDSGTLHIWKTNSLLLRFWVNALKNPQLIFDVRVSDNVDAILAVIAQTFIDSCTTSEHKVGRVRAAPAAAAGRGWRRKGLWGKPRGLCTEPWVGGGSMMGAPSPPSSCLAPPLPPEQDSPVNKLLYAREIPRYKQMVERYYADIHQSSPASYQEMNSALAELSGNYTSAPHCLEALQELYNHIHRYYDQIISALEEDPLGQKLQLACRLQQVAALVENKVTDL